MSWRRATTLLATLLVNSPTLLVNSHAAMAGALDDIRIEASREPCGGAGTDDSNVVVYASNLNPVQFIDANFKYDSSPAQQHFILFDANLSPITDRFPKFHARRLGPHESATIGCTYTYRTAPQAPAPLKVPVIIAKQSASYVVVNAPEPAAEDARSFAAFLLQGGINECAAGAKPPGLFYLVNLHPYARLSVSMSLLDDRGSRVGVQPLSLPPWGAVRVACSNGPSRPAPIGSANLEVFAGFATRLPTAPALEVTTVPEARSPATPPRELPANPDESLAPLSLGAMLRVQNVCAGVVPSGWIKINDAWNPTVCGNPATLTYNVWMVQQLPDQPSDAVIHACKGPVPSGWSIVGTTWNPTVCGHPSANQSNVMAIKRLN